MAADSALAKLSESAGPEGFDDALTLLGKLFHNIVEQPTEHKFRRLNPQNPKLQATLFRHAGVSELFTAAGFGPTDDGSLELLPSKMNGFLDANSAVQRQLQQQRKRQAAAETVMAAQKVSANYQAAIHGGARGAGLADLEALRSSEGGPEVIQVLEKIISNIRRYPDNKKYQSLNLKKAAGQKVLPALPLLQMAGFVRRQEPAGEDVLELPFVDLHLVERLQAMLFWSMRPKVPDLQPNSERLSRALGAALGACIGDALGGPLAGKREYDVSAKEIDKVMEMSGGGIWGLAPGQTSDNTEMSLCLADALASVRASGFAGHFPLEDIAMRYGKWGQTAPFHFEQACGQVFRGALSAEVMMEKARNQNNRAVGAGALVRCPVLGAFAASLPSASEAAELGRVDARLSHPSLSMGTASAAYVVLTRCLIMTDGDARTAGLAALREWIEKELAALESPHALAVAGAKSYVHLDFDKPNTSASGKEEEIVPAGARLVAVKEVMSWISIAFAGYPYPPPFTEELLTSSARVSFTHALRHLKLGSSFEHAMRATLAGGGDCCGNAAIVGGVVGAAVGLEGIPARWIHAVLGCEAAHMRPQEYHPNRLPELVQKIMNGA